MKELIITFLSDICVIVFDLLLYSQLTKLRRTIPKARAILYVGCTVIVAFYSIAVYVLSWPVSISAFVCMTLPSLALFWVLCQYRDARFFLTFCCVDTVSLIVGFIARYIGILLGNVGGIVSVAVMLAAFTFIYKAGKPYFESYREALDFIDTGWKRLTFTAAFIYIALIFIAAYPKPMIERQEYLLPYLVLSLMVLAFYLVFFTNIMMAKKMYEQSAQLTKQQKWFKMAYVDALTEIPNRMAYIEKIHDIERKKDCSESVAIVVMDLDSFKHINDTFGHSMGDAVLKSAAKRMSRVFSDDYSTVYRIGGDEFAAITVDASEEDIVNRLKGLKDCRIDSLDYNISYGYSFIDASEENAVDKAFSRADTMMYLNKHNKTVDDEN